MSGTEGGAAPITAEEAKCRMDGSEPVTFVDARDGRAWDRAEWQLPQSRRMPVDRVNAHLDDLPIGGLIVPYGNDRDDPASHDVARMLMQYGWTNVRPLLGGAEAWRRAGYPTESKPTRVQSESEVSVNVRDAEGDE